MIYCIYGCDIEFLINQEIHKDLKENIDDINDFNVVYYDYDSKNLANIITDCQTIPFLSDKKGIVVKNCTFLNKDEDVKELIEYINHPFDSTVLILLYNGDINDKLDIVNILKNKAKMIRIKDIESKDWPIVINQLINKYNLDIDDDARNEFVTRTAGDLDNVIRELAKLHLIDSKITLDLVKTLIPRPLDDNIFNMVDFILNKQNDKSIQLFRDLIINDSNNLDLVIASLGTQFRFLYNVIHLHNKGYSNDEIASNLSGVKSGRVYFALKKTSGYGEKDILDLLYKLASLHENIRTGNIDDKVLAFELFLIGDK